jgi:hypothetical protein
MKIDDSLAPYALKMLVVFEAAIIPFNIARTLNDKSGTNFSHSQKGPVNRIQREIREALPHFAP